MTNFFVTVIFYLLFDCCTANFGPLLKGKPHKADVNYMIYLFGAL